MKTTTGLLKWPKSKTLAATSADKDVEQHCYEYKMVATLESSAGYYKTKHTFTI
jgi:hypothetical protein